MDFFDKLGKKASQTYKATAEKTGKMAKEAKIKLKISENKSLINDLYEEIGKKVYEKYNLKETLDINIDLEEECTKIDVLSAEIESLLNQSRELKDKKQCPSCFEEIEKSVQFCPKCGAKQEIKEENKEENKQENTEEAKEVEVLEKQEQKSDVNTQFDDLKKEEIPSDDESVKDVTDVEVGVATENTDDSILDNDKEKDEQN